MSVGVRRGPRRPMTKPPQLASFCLYPCTSSLRYPPLTMPMNSRRPGWLPLPRAKFPLGGGEAPSEPWRRARAWPRRPARVDRDPSTARQEEGIVGHTLASQSPSSAASVAPSALALTPPASRLQPVATRPPLRHPGRCLLPPARHHNSPSEPPLRAAPPYASLAHSDARRHAGVRARQRPAGRRRGPALEPAPEPGPVELPAVLQYVSPPPQLSSPAASLRRLPPRPPPAHRPPPDALVPAPGVRSVDLRASAGSPEGVDVQVGWPR